MIFEISVIVVSITFVVLVVYLVCTLVQVRRTARAAEEMLTETKELASQTRQVMKGVSRGVHVLGALGDSIGAVRGFKAIRTGNIVKQIVYLPAIVKGFGVGLSVLLKRLRKGGDDHV